MHSNPRITGAALVAAALLLALLPTARTAPQGNSGPSEEPVPAYHTGPPTGDLPQTMDPEEFGHPVIKNAYALAGKVKKVLYQEPCYCHCDRSQGHGSLLDCFVSRHGSGCETCVKEAFYSYEETRRGKTPGQIRDSILHGEWQSVDLSKYQMSLPPLSAPAK